MTLSSMSASLLCSRRAEAWIIVRDERDYLYAEFRSRLLGYVDDVEFFFDGAAIQVRSGSRLGRRDFGVNRKRVETIRRLMRG